jgi:hypothetical protein
VVHERRVLLRVEYLQKSRPWISSNIVSSFVDLVQKNDWVVDARPLEAKMTRTKPLLTIYFETADLKAHPMRHSWNLTKGRLQHCECQCVLRFQGRDCEEFLGKSAQIKFFEKLCQPSATLPSAFWRSPLKSTDDVASFSPVREGKPSPVRGIIRNLKSTLGIQSLIRTYVLDLRR